MVLGYVFTQATFSCCRRSSLAKKMSTFIVYNRTKFDLCEWFFHRIEIENKTVGNQQKPEGLTRKQFSLLFFSYSDLLKKSSDTKKNHSGNLNCAGQKVNE